jgi:hypothetical protein
MKSIRPLLQTVPYNKGLPKGRKIVYSFLNATQQQKEKHVMVVSDYMWKTITYLAEQVAFELLTERQKQMYRNVHRQKKLQ